MLNLLKQSFIFIYFTNSCLDLDQELLFQDPATRFLEFAINFHHDVLLIMLCFFCLVLWFIIRINFVFKNNTYPNSRHRKILNNKMVFLPNTRFFFNKKIFYGLIFLFLYIFLNVTFQDLAFTGGKKPTLIYPFHRCRYQTLTHVSNEIKKINMNNKYNNFFHFGHPNLFSEENKSDHAFKVDFNQNLLYGLNNRFSYPEQNDFPKNFSENAACLLIYSELVKTNKIFENNFLMQYPMGKNNLGKISPKIHYKTETMIFNLTGLKLDLYSPYLLQEMSTLRSQSLKDFLISNRYELGVQCKFDFKKGPIEIF